MMERNGNVYHFMFDIFMALFYRVGSEHNKVVTQKIVKDIITSGVFTNLRDVECKYTAPLLPLPASDLL